MNSPLPLPRRLVDLPLDSPRPRAPVTDGFLFCFCFENKISNTFTPAFEIISIEDPGWLNTSRNSDGILESDVTKSYNLIIPKPNRELTASHPGIA